MDNSHVRDSTHPVNPEPLRDFEFLSFAALMAKLPETTSREAIRDLVKNRGLKAHKIGKTKFFYVRDVIAASAIGEDDDSEE
jgi:hypothetical protein